MSDKTKAVQGIDLLAGPVPLVPVRQEFPRPRVADLDAECVRAVAAFAAAIRPGMSVAITAGSRGIAGIPDILKAVIGALKACQAKPFIVPAMGSHGSATAEGQAALLADYGITAERMGVPIRSSMETVELPGNSRTRGVFMDRFAWESDGVVLINRIKPHTSFHGDYESGLVKMAVIGLGKHRQALAIHSFGVHGLTQVMPATAECILASGRILGGIGIVENAYDETLCLRGMPACDILRIEPELLALAKRNMPRLPVDNIDLLIVDRMGKNISGLGMDPNIIGRLMIRGEPEPVTPCIRSLVVADLTDESHGNACGVGLADVITRRLWSKIDFAATYENVYTSTFLERAKIPVTAETDRQAVTYGLRACCHIAPGQERIIRIRDTLQLGSLLVSPAVLAEIRDQPGVVADDEPAALFDGDNLAAWPDFCHA